jgi:tetratricopeptide (TPR) repeat protein
LDPGNTEARTYLDELERAVADTGAIVDSTVLLATWLTRATQLTRADEFGAAATVYDTIVQIFPDNDDAHRSLARLLAWGGRYDSAIVVYEALLVDTPNDVEARKGLARTRGWSGDLTAAELEWLAVVSSNPDDGEAQLGLAQVRRWSGRLEAADTALTRAERLIPGNPLVRQERLALQQSRAATTDPFIIFETDSDGNDMTTFLVAAGSRVAPRIFLTGRLIFRSARNSNLTSGNFTSTTAALDGTYDLNTRWSLRAGLGVNTTSGAADNRLIVRAGTTGPPWHGITPTLDYRHEPLDVTAQLIANGVYFDELAVGGYGSPSGWTVNGSYGFALFHGSESNTRHLVSGLALRPIWKDVSAGGRLRLFSFAKNLNDGYFDPSLYLLLEVPVRWTRQFDKWLLFGELNPGFQLINTETADVNSQVTIGGNARVTYSVAQGREIGVMALASRSGLQTLATPIDGYRYYMIGAFGSWNF